MRDRFIDVPVTGEDFDRAPRTVIAVALFALLLLVVLALGGTYALAAYFG